MRGLSWVLGAFLLLVLSGPLGENIWGGLILLATVGILLRETE